MRDHAIPRVLVILNTFYPDEEVDRTVLNRMHAGDVKKMASLGEAFSKMAMGVRPCK